MRPVGCDLSRGQQPAGSPFEIVALAHELGVSACTQGIPSRPDVSVSPWYGFGMKNYDKKSEN